MPTELTWWGVFRAGELKYVFKTMAAAERVRKTSEEADSDHTWSIATIKITHE